MNKQDQQSYIIWQHHLSQSGQIALECDGWSSKNPEVRAYSSKMAGSKKFKPMDWKFYRPAMRVRCNGLEGVFAAGNGYPKEGDHVEKLGEAYSCSVGDIVQCGGLYWMCDPYGWKDISDKMKLVKMAMRRFHPELVAEQEAAL